MFGVLEHGFLLATALHAPGVNEAFEVLCHHNGIPDEQAARVELVVYIAVYRVRGGGIARRVAAVYEIAGVADGVPNARLLHRHHVEDDSFEAVASSQFIGTGPAYHERLARFRAALEA